MPIHDHLSADLRAAILIEHCIRLNIPIPRASDKQVTVEGNCIVVSFMKEIEIDH